MSEEDPANPQGKRNRFVAALDVLLLEETNHQDPYHARNPSETWKQIADTLNKTGQFKVPLTDRAWKTGAEKLVNAYGSEDLKDLVKSGSESDYGKIEALLTTLVAAKKDVAESKVQRKAKKDADTKKRDVVTLRIQEAGESTFPKSKKSVAAKKSDGLEEYRLPGTSSNASDWMSDSENSEPEDVTDKEPTADNSGGDKTPSSVRNRSRLRKKLKPSAESDVVKAVVQGDRLKYDFKTKELAQAREIEQLKMQQQKDLTKKQMEIDRDLRAEASLRSHQVRMKELDLEDRKLAIRERELTLQEKKLDM